MSRYWWYQAGLRTGMHKLSHTCSYLFDTTIPAYEQVLVVSGMNRYRTGMRKV